jgi:hypothetical protein
MGIAGCDLPPAFKKHEFQNVSEGKTLGDWSGSRGADPKDARAAQLSCNGRVVAGPFAAYHELS